MEKVETSAMPESSPHPLEAAALAFGRHWRALVGLPCVAGVLAAAMTLFVASRYESVTIFSPSQRVAPKLPSSLLSIASSFGINAPDDGYSVYYFARVLQSREALRHVASDTLVLEQGRVAVLDVL